MLLDTYAWVEFFNATQKGKVVKRILKSNPCFSSAISLAELSEWVEREKLGRKKIFQAVKTLSIVLALDGETLELAGILKIQKRKRAKGIGMIDSIVLATAGQYGLQIVTGGKHFAGENVLFLK